MNNIKILHIDTEMGWRGGQQQAVYLFENLFKKGFSTEFVCKPGSELSAYFKKNDLPYIEVKMSNELDFISAYKIAKHCKNNKFNILHLHSAHAHSIGLLAKFFYRKLKIIGVRRVDFKIKNNIFSRFKYNSWLIDKIVCISEEIKRVMLSSGVDKDKLTVIHSGVNLNKFDNVKADPYLRKQYNIPANDIIIGTVAALVGHKDYPNLLKAASIVLKKRKDVTFLAVGDGKNEEDIKKLHKELGLGNKFIFAGYQKEVGKFLRSFDIFVLASKMEGLGTSILDAQSVALPVIATKAGGIPEMIENGVNGILVEPQSPEKLAEAISDLVDNEEKRNIIGKNGNVSVEQFSIDHTVEKNINLYEELLGSE
ncbi:MAG: glycosyltransferase [Candidatus Delongbacteria bacterium]|jgi:glycosyltransferase involved in cell wall biosynthesis|nr:glycosyltransferase [Candidatus Delongbacteria bacterium]